MHVHVHDKGGAKDPDPDPNPSPNPNPNPNPNPRDDKTIKELRKEITTLRLTQVSNTTTLKHLIEQLKLLQAKMDGGGSGGGDGGGNADLKLELELLRKSLASVTVSLTDLRKDGASSQGALLAQLTALNTTLATLQVAVNNLRDNKPGSPGGTADPTLQTRITALETTIRKLTTDLAVHTSIESIHTPQLEEIEIPSGLVTGEFWTATVLLALLGALLSALWFRARRIRRDLTELKQRLEELKSIGKPKDPDTNASLEKEIKLLQVAIANLAGRAGPGGGGTNHIKVDVDASGLAGGGSGGGAEVETPDRDSLVRWAEAFRRKS